MKTVTAFVAAGIVLAGCTRVEEEPESNAGAEASANASVGAQEDGGWNLESTGQGVALVLGPATTPAIRLVCAAGQDRLLVNVPDFRPIGSEERLSFGSGGEVVALVADTRGDSERGGVSGTGAVPKNLAALLSSPVSASYGAQSSGPHQALPVQLAAAFVAACNGDVSAGVQTPATPEAPASTHPCLVQDGNAVPENRLKAIGTEPFWGAEIRGRCVTYSTPEDQDGTRIWTQFGGSAERGEWTGYLDDQSFVLRTRPEPGCSDGMSDRRYPIAVTLTVRGEERKGCAYPL